MRCHSWSMSTIAATLNPNEMRDKWIPFMIENDLLTWKKLTYHIPHMQTYRSLHSIRKNIIKHMHKNRFLERTRTGFIFVSVSPVHNWDGQSHSISDLTMPLNPRSVPNSIHSTSLDFLVSDRVVFHCGADKIFLHQILHTSIYSSRVKALPPSFRRFP